MVIKSKTKPRLAEFKIVDIVNKLTVYWVGQASGYMDAQRQMHREGIYPDEPTKILKGGVSY